MSKRVANIYYTGLRGICGGRVWLGQVIKRFFLQHEANFRFLESPHGFLYFATYRRALRATSVINYRIRKICYFGLISRVYVFFAVDSGFREY